MTRLVCLEGEKMRELGAAGYVGQERQVRSTGEVVGSVQLEPLAPDSRRCPSERAFLAEVGPEEGGLGMRIRAICRYCEIELRKLLTIRVTVFAWTSCQTHR